MKYVLFYEAAVDTSRIREVFPAHRAKWAEFSARGELLMIGPFTDPTRGAMAIFKTREGATEFAQSDPFVVEGVVRKWHVEEWREALVSE